MFIGVIFAPRYSIANFHIVFIQVIHTILLETDKGLIIRNKAK